MVSNRASSRTSGTWAQGQEVICEDGEVIEYRVKMKVTFIVDD